MNPTGPRISFESFFAARVRQCQPPYNTLCLSRRTQVRTVIAKQWADSEGLAPPYPDWFYKECNKVGTVWL